MALFKRYSWAGRMFVLAVSTMSFMLLGLSLSSTSNGNPRQRHHHKHYDVEKQSIEDGFDRQASDVQWGPRLPRPTQVIYREIERPANETTRSSSHDDDVKDVYYETNQSYSTSLLTLFTTMKDTENRSVIHNNTLENWAALKPYITPVLFVENNTRDQWRTLALELGWDIKNVTRTNLGIPTLRHMFIQVQKEYNTPFYGFANADILFDNTLIENLKAFSMYKNYTNNLFLVGKRTNLNVSQSELQNMTVSSPNSVSQLSKKYGILFESYAQDYFITTRKGFPWRKMPNLVVGRAGYDNWLVVKAQEWKLTVVDASYTINAVHQTGMDGNRAGWGVQDNRCMNRDIIGRFNYTTGHTKCVPYISYRDIMGEIKIFHRPAISKDCSLSHRRIRYQRTLGCV